MNGHLSRLYIAAQLQPSPRDATGSRVMSHHDVASDRVYRVSQSPERPVSSYLAFPPLPRSFGQILLNGRYISVALFLRSPSAAVSRYPCPAMLGLSSCNALSSKARDRLFCSFFNSTIFLCSCQMNFFGKKNKSRPAHWNNKPDGSEYKRIKKSPEWRASDSFQCINRSWYRANGLHTRRNFPL